MCLLERAQYQTSDHTNPLFFPADAGGGAARLFFVWTRLAAQQGQTADHTKPPFFFLAHAGGRAARLSIGWR